MYPNWPVLVANEQVATTFNSIQAASITFALVSYDNWPVLVANEQVATTFTGITAASIT
jgi:hypothetical protein